MRAIKMNLEMGCKRSAKRKTAWFHGARAPQDGEKSVQFIWRYFWSRDLSTAHKFQLAAVNKMED